MEPGAGAVVGPHTLGLRPRTFDLGPHDFQYLAFSVGTPFRGPRLEVHGGSLRSEVRCHSRVQSCWVMNENSTEKNPKKLIIAIDGPAGAGKSTIAARIARKLGYVNLESGAMYRALALKAIDRDASFDDEMVLVKLADASNIRLEPTITGNRTLLDGRDVSSRIRERDVTEGASRISVHPKVREWMVSHQRAMGAGGGVVMEGRDIGTKVFPDADLKIFLDADPVVREQRRMAQQHISGEVAANVAADLRERDRRDRTRAASPLMAAEDAVVINSTSMSEDEVLARVEELVEQKQSLNEPGFKVS
jgi:CMP/dCMP kinase